VSCALFFALRNEVRFVKSRPLVFQDRGPVIPDREMLLVRGQFVLHVAVRNSVYFFTFSTNIFVAAPFAILLDWWLF
jgi:hypothetical protein